MTCPESSVAVALIYETQHYFIFQNYHKKIRLKTLQQG